MSADGIDFFTHETSQKGRELAANPVAALVFHWKRVERQVRVEGPVTRVPEAHADAYFHSRPLRSRLGALVSDQSQVLHSRADLLAALAAAEARYGVNPPRPPRWGGFRVQPVRFEFWQGQRNRLHDRFRYERDGASWRIERLFP